MNNNTEDGGGIKPRHYDMKDENMSVQMATEQDEMKRYWEEMAEYLDGVERRETNLTEPIPPETKEDIEYWKQERQRRLEEINNRLVLDIVANEKVRYIDLVEKYGSDLADKIDKDKWLEIEDYKVARDIHNGKKNADTNKVENTNKKPSKAKKKVSQFNRVSFDRLDNLEYLKKYASKSLVYERLRRFIVRGKHKDDKLELYERYYQRRKLVSSLSQRRLAEEFGLSKTP